MLKEPKIKLIKSELNIKCEKQKFSLTQFSKDIVINQFYESNKGATSFRSGMIYIRIPKTLKILGDGKYQ
ncbi:hypothetical protein [Clostridium sp.]|uniref:hypothetical protein n=1 Tax=Clostridium sp. TaxID=1506 RepID=UPI0025C344F7|nr:hypothetical protein [Clostridium sp.]